MKLSRRMQDVIHALASGPKWYDELDLLATRNKLRSAGLIQRTNVNGQPWDGKYELTKAGRKAADELEASTPTKEDMQSKEAEN